MNLLHCFAGGALTILLSACCPNGCFVMHGKAFERLAYSRPFLESWEMPGKSADDRSRDAAACGGGHVNVPSFSPNAMKKASRAGESMFQGGARLFREWEVCMIKKGYRYTGECYDNEISRTLPRCQDRLGPLGNAGNAAS